MNRVRETVNGLLVEVFNHILFIEEQYMKHQGVTLSMTEVHILENVEKSETKTLGDVARLQMVTPGTLSVAVNSLVRKGYIMKCKDLQDKRVVRLLLSAKANEVLRIHHQFHEEMVDVYKRQALGSPVILKARRTGVGCRKWCSPPARKLKKTWMP